MGTMKADSSIVDITSYHFRMLSIFSYVALLQLANNVVKKEAMIPLAVIIRGKYIAPFVSTKS